MSKQKLKHDWHFEGFRKSRCRNCNCEKLTRVFTDNTSENLYRKDGEKNWSINEPYCI